MSPLVLAFGIAAVMGHGPNTPGKISSILMLALGTVFALLSFGSRTRIGGAFTHGKAASAPISAVGRLILLLTGVTLIVTAARALLA